MANKRDLEKRLASLRGEEDIDDLPLASICLIIAADEIESGDRPGVTYLDGEPHRVGDLQSDINFSTSGSGDGEGGSENDE